MQAAGRGCVNISTQVDQQAMADALKGSCPIKGVIFDLDGTLLDTELLSVNAINAVLQSRVPTAEWSVQQHLGIIGMKGADWTKIVLRECCIAEDAALSPELLETQWEEVLGGMVGEAQALPGKPPLPSPRSRMAAANLHGASA